MENLPDWLTVTEQSRSYLSATCEAITINQAQELLDSNGLAIVGMQASGNGRVKLDFLKVESIRGINS